MADGDVRFKIDGKLYDAGAVDQISLRDVVLFNRQAADMGLGVTWADVERISGEMAGLGPKDDPHPDAMIMFAVTVWAARRIAGDDVTLEEAVDVPMSSIEIVEAPKGPKVPKDHQPKKAKGKGSGLAAVPAEAEESTTPQTSTQQSASA